MKAKSKTKQFVINVYDSKAECGIAAAEFGAAKLRSAIRKNGKASIILATGASQFEMLSTLAELPGIDWPKVTIFHLDEYVGLKISHPASFRRYLWERFVSKLPLPPAEFVYINGEGDPEAECARVGKIIKAKPVDVAFVGIGENGHLAFNDPPADFKTKKPYIVVKLDAACRRQQLGEGWFKALRDVPTKAISMSIFQIMSAKTIVCTVPDARKAQAVKNCLGDGTVTAVHPASILKKHPDTTFFMDEPAVSLLE